MERAIVNQAHEELETMLNILSNSFTTVREILARSANPHRSDLNRRIQEVNLEFTRIRANGMRHSFERNLARQEQERRMRARRDSDSSTDSDNSDFDLDFVYPVDLWEFSTPSGCNRTTNDASNNTDITNPVNTAQSDQSAVTSTPSSSTLSSDNSSSSSHPSHEQQTSVKRKLSDESEEAPPAKRSMATSTDDAYFNQI